MIRQPSRMIVGHCPHCASVLAVEIQWGQSWPLVQCRCDWAGGVPEIAGATLYETDMVRRIDR